MQLLHVWWAKLTFLISLVLFDSYNSLHLPNTRLRPCNSQAITTFRHFITLLQLVLHFNYAITKSNYELRVVIITKLQKVFWMWA